jgi:FtsH-binding integral membrane protein
MTMAISILILIVLACCEFHKKHPYNHLSFWWFSASATAFLMVITAIYSTQIVYLALLIVVCSNFLLTLSLMQSKVELTVYTGLLVALIGFGVALGILMCAWVTTWMNILYSGLGALAFIVVPDSFSCLCPIS